VRPPDIEHEGWINAQTWGIALFIDNDPWLLKNCLAIVRYSPMRRVEVNLREWIKGLAYKDIAPWAFEDKDAWERISWPDLINHWSLKVKDGAR